MSSKQLTRQRVITVLEDRMVMLKKEINALLTAGTPEEHMSIKNKRIKYDVYSELFLLFYHDYDY